MCDFLVKSCQFKDLQLILEKKTNPVRFYIEFYIESNFDSNLVENISLWFDLSSKLCIILQHELLHLQEFHNSKFMYFCSCVHLGKTEEENVLPVVDSCYIRNTDWYNKILSNYFFFLVPKCTFPMSFIRQLRARKGTVTIQRCSLENQ